MRSTVIAFVIIHLLIHEMISTPYGIIAGFTASVVMLFELSSDVLVFSEWKAGGFHEKIGHFVLGTIGEIFFYCGDTLLAHIFPCIPILRRLYAGHFCPSFPKLSTLQY